PSHLKHITASLRIPFMRELIFKRADNISTQASIYIQFIYKGFALVKTPASRACEVHTVNRVICKPTIELLVLNWEIRKKLLTRRFQVMNKTKAVNQTKKHDGVK